MQQQKYSDYQYILAYGMFIALMMLVARSRFGYVTLYYSLALTAFGLVLLRASSIVNILKPIQVQ